METRIEPFEYDQMRSSSVRTSPVCVVMWCWSMVPTSSCSQCVPAAAAAHRPASVAILDLAYSMRMAPRSLDNKNDPCSACMALAAPATSRYSTNATGAPAAVPTSCPLVAQAPLPAADVELPVADAVLDWLPLECSMRRRQKPGKLCRQQ